MSRLLQALKNLEARSPKAAPAKSVLAHLADKFRPPLPDPPAKSVLANLADKFRPPSPDPSAKSVLAHLADRLHSPSPDPSPTHVDSGVVCRPTPLKPQPLDSPLAYLSASVPTILLETRPAPAIEEPEVRAVPEIVNRWSPPPVNVPPPAAPLSAPSQFPIATLPVFAATRPATVAPPVAEAPPPPLAEPAVSLPSVALPRQPTLLERAIRRTLSDPGRSEPLRQLADRLRSDLDQVAGRSILITGIGPASETHEVTLHVAAILAEAGEPILVIDGDAAHRTLTGQLDFSDAFGLAELAKNQEPANDPIQATTIDHLSLLPLGKARMPDPATVGNRLASLVQSLEESYRLVLVDGGRAGELNAAALARLCDATYFVVRLGETEASLAQTALRDFRAAGARILGCIATS